MREQHFIITLGRSGSNTLVDMLNQNPAVLNYGEVLGPWTPIRKIQQKIGLSSLDNETYLDGLLGNEWVIRAANLMRSYGKIKNGKRNEIKSLSRVRTVGIKDFSLNLEDLGLRRYLVDRPHIKVIGLVRRNSFARMVSARVLNQTGVVAIPERQKARAQESTHLKMTPEDVLADLAVVDRERQLLERLLDDLPEERVFRIDYEDFFSSPQRTSEIVKAAQQFLGVPVYNPATRMGKILSADPLDAFYDRDRIKHAIARSQFAHFLSET